MENVPLNILIQAQDEASAVLKNFSDTLDDNQKKAGQWSQNLKIAGGILTGVGIAGVAMMKDWVDKASEVETAQAQLEHAVIGVSHATKDQLSQTEALADALQKKGVLDGDNIKIGLAQLSTFGLSNKAVQGLGGSLADLAVNQFGVSASGDQLSQSANMIAKALNGQFGVLEKSGIRFTDAQQKLIQFGTEQQKVDTINQGFAQNLKYTNEVALKTSEGMKAHLSVALEDQKEKLGGQLLPLWEKFQGGLIKLLEIINNLNPNIIKFVAIGTLIVTAFSLIVGPLLILIAMLPALGAGFAMLTGTMLPIIGTILLVVAGVALLAFGIYELVKHWDSVKAFFVNIGNAIKTFVTTALSTVGGFFTNLWNSVTSKVNQIVNGIKTGFNNALNAVKTVFNGIANVIKTVFEIIKTIIVTYLTFYFNFYYTIFNAIFTVVSYVFTQIWTVIKFVGELIWAGIQIVFWAIYEFIAGVLQKLWDTIGVKFMAILQLIGEKLVLIWNAVSAFFVTFWNGIVTVFTTIWNFIVTIFTSVYNFFVTTFTTIWTFLVGIFQSIYDAISGALTIAWNFIVENLTKVWNKFIEVFNGVKTAVMTPIQEAFSWLGNQMDAIWTKITDVAGKILQKFKDMASGIVNALKEIKFPHLSLGSGTTTVAGHEISYPKLSVDWYEQGGWVKKTGLAVVHQDEFVMSKDMLRGRTPVPSSIVNQQSSKSNEIKIEAIINNPMDWDTMMSKLNYKLNYSY